jgi:hypothetical protein
LVQKGGKRKFFEKYENAKIAIFANFANFAIFAKKSRPSVYD